MQGGWVGGGGRVGALCVVCMLSSVGAAERTVGTLTRFLWKINVADAFKKYTSRSKLEAEAAPSTRQGQVQVQV